MTKLSKKATEIYFALVSCHEGMVSDRFTSWCNVYLDNARPAGMSARSFAGYLSQLQKAGVYKSYDDGENDGIWGDVLVSQALWSRSRPYAC